MVNVKEHQIYYLLILISRGNTLCRPSSGSSEVTRSNWTTLSADPAQSLTSEKLTRRVAREPWQAVPSIHYQSWSRSRLLVTYISLVTAFSLSNPGKCVQFGPNRKVLEIVFLAPARGGGREMSEEARFKDCGAACWSGWCCMPSGFEQMNEHNGDVSLLEASEGGNHWSSTVRTK